MLSNAFLQEVQYPLLQILHSRAHAQKTVGVSGDISGSSRHSSLHPVLRILGSLHARHPQKTGDGRGDQERSAGQKNDLLQQPQVLRRARRRPAAAVGHQPPEVQVGDGAAETNAGQQHGYRDGGYSGKLLAKSDPEEERTASW